MLIRYSKKGTILIFAIWSLSLLSMLVIYLGAGIRQKITFLNHLEKKSVVSLLAESGIKKAIALLNTDLVQNDYEYTANGKVLRHNNTFYFKDIGLDGGFCEVSYPYPEGPDQKRFGFIDEESKININLASVDMLTDLVAIVLGTDEEASKEMAVSIVDWREEFQQTLNGFYSDNYYESLKDPYPVKKAPFKIIDELMLVQGITPNIFYQLLPYVTVYGDGAVNINTASPAVLFSLGLSERLTNKIIETRRGADRIESTPDDLVFQEIKDIQTLMKLSKEEKRIINQLIEHKLIKVNSRFYFIRSIAMAANHQFTKTIFCTFDSAKSRIIYWRER